MEEGDLVVENLAVGSDRFAYNSSIDPKVIVHDESSEATTIAFFKGLVPFGVESPRAATPS
jgi:hypothetical protein